MAALLNPLSFLVACISGWLNEHQPHAIEYLTEENRILREHIGDRRICFTDDQRRRLAVRAMAALSRLITRWPSRLLTQSPSESRFAVSPSFERLAEQQCCTKPSTGHLVEVFHSLGRNYWTK